MACGTTISRSAASRPRPSAVAASRHALDRAAPDVAEEGRGVEGERQRGGGQGWDVEAGEGRAEIGQEQLHEKRRALHDGDEGNADPARHARARHAQHGDQQAADAAAEQRDAGEGRRPERGVGEEFHMREREGLKHLIVRRT
jgi:hypothetical protein